MSSLSLRCRQFPNERSQTNTQWRDMLGRVVPLFRRKIRSAVLTVMMSGTLAPRGELTRPSKWDSAREDKRLTPSVTRSFVASARDSQSVTITTVPESLAVQRQLFSSYDVPGLCLAAARQRQVVLDRTLASQASFDYLAASHERDTLGEREVARVARLCGAKFTAANTAPRDLDDLFHLAILAQDDSLSLAVLARESVLRTTDSARAALFEDAAIRYSESEPMRLGALLSLIARMDMAGKREVIFATGIDSIVRQRLNWFEGEAIGLQYAEQLIALGQHGHIPSRHADLLNAAYRVLMWHALVQDPDSMPTVAQRAQQDLGRVDERWRTLSLDQMMDSLAPAGYRTAFFSTGSPLTLTADYWFPAPGQRGDTIRPVPGKVNLVCAGGEPTQISSGANQNEERFDFLGDGYGGYAVAARIRRWLAAYGARGLVITLLHSVHGWSRGAGVYTARLYTSPADEARHWQWYYQQFEQLPVTVGLQNQPDTLFLPAPDGRRMPIDARHDHFPTVAGIALPVDHGGVGGCLIIGRDGRRIAYGQEQSKIVGQNKLTLWTSPISAVLGEAEDEDPYLRWERILQLLMRPLPHDPHIRDFVAPQLMVGP